MNTQEQQEIFFNEQLKPVLDEVEALRKKILEKGKRNKLFLSGFGILLFLYSYTTVQGWADTGIQKFTMSAFLIILLVAVYISIRPELFLPRTERNRIFKLYTNGVVREMLRSLHKSFNYQPIFKTNIRLFERSKLFANKISAYQETYGIIGKMNGVELKISEVEFRNKLITDFQGWFISFDLDIECSDFALFCSENSMNFWDNKADVQLVKEGKLHSYTADNNTNTVANSMLELFKKHRPKIANEMQLSVVDKRLYIAITNDNPFFQFSFRDDNSNLFGAYMDFNKMGLIANYLEEICTDLVVDSGKTKETSQMS